MRSPAVAAMALALASGCRTRPEAPVILVSIDTLRPDHLGCYGYPRPTSPHLDAFRRDAVLFQKAIAHAPSTLSSHASILTSLLPPHHGASISNDLAVPREVTTLAEVLRAEGYLTASFNGGVQLDPVWGLDQGFDTYASVKPRGAPAESLIDEHDRFAHITEQARAFILNHEGRPFFLFLHTYEVHHPYSPDAADLDAFRGDYKGPLPDLITVDLLRQIDGGSLRISDGDRQHVVDAYDAEIRSMDRAFGAFVGFLRERKLYHDALIVVTSDHGEEFGEHGRLGWHSHSLYDELLRVPLLVKLPASRLGGGLATEQVRGIDVAPTVLSALGLGIPAPFEGRDLLKGGSPGAAANEAWSSRDVTEPNAVISLRTPEWKLFDARLYDLLRDPGEREDVAKSHADVARRLSERRKAIAADRPRPARRPATPDDELRERLRSLGYVE